MPHFTDLQVKIFPEALCEYLAQWSKFDKRCNTELQS